MLRSGLLRPRTLGFALHPLEPLVVVGELLHVRRRDLAGDDRIVAGDVRLRVVGPVLELDVHAGPKLLEVEARPVDADLVADSLRLFGRRAPLLGHLVSPLTCVEGASADAAGASRASSRARRRSRRAVAAVTARA